VRYAAMTIIGNENVSTSSSTEIHHILDIVKIFLHRKV